jgi:hypothetical protein
MTRLGITFDDVARSAEDILAAGNNPTIERVRRVLGTGSNSTIAKYLQDWRADRLLESSQKISNKNTAPDAVNAAVSQVWEKIRLETEAEITAVHDNAKAMIEAIQKEHNDAIKSRDLLQAELEMLNQRFNQISADKEIALLDLKAAEREQLLLKERYHHLENQYNTFKNTTHDQMAVMTVHHQCEIDNKNKEITNIKETFDKTLGKLVESYENTRQEHMLIIDHHKTEKQRDNNTIKQLDSAIQDMRHELSEVQTQLKLAIYDRDSAMNTCHLKDEIIKQYETNKESTNLILNEVKTLKNANQADFQSIISELQDSTDDLKSVSQSILNWMNQKERIGSE